MTLVCVSILADEVHTALERAAHARLAGADLVEFRLDHLFRGEGDHEGAEACERLVRESGAACIVTCRPVWEGGDYDGSEAARLGLLERLATMEGGPRYIDVEQEVAERAGGAERAVGAHAGGVRHGVGGAGAVEGPGVIVSTHDFSGRPADLLQRVARMREDPTARVHKVAFLARTVRDNLELFDLLGQRDRPMIALAMGEAGLMSRVLAPKFGGFLTFASLRPTETTAPGQPTVSDLLETYRFRSIGRGTGVYGVMGWPLGHSMSPLVHNAGFEAVGHDGVYVPMPVAPEWEAFKATLGEFAGHEGLGFRGASVTAPHKEHLVRFAEERAGEGWLVDGLASACGAANTASRTEEGWLVENTDARAGADLVRGACGGSLEGRRVELLGAGGVARGISAGLMELGAEVVVRNRTRARAEGLARDLHVRLASSAGSIEAGEWEERGDGGADVVVQCTPMGMRGGGDEEGSALDAARVGGLKDGAVVFETVYAPVETGLVRMARERGLRVIDGVDLFVGQAALQFQRWTGARAAPGLFERVVRERVE